MTCARQVSSESSLSVRGNIELKTTHWGLRKDTDLWQRLCLTWYKSSLDAWVILLCSDMY